MSGERASSGLDRSRCALCGEPNDCALAREGAAETQAPCWCVGRRFPDELRERASARDGGASCVCRRCLESAIDGTHDAG